MSWFGYGKEEGKKGRRGIGETGGGNKIFWETGRREGEKREIPLFPLSVPIRPRLLHPRPLRAFSPLFPLLLLLLLFAKAFRQNLVEGEGRKCIFGVSGGGLLQKRGYEMNKTEPDSESRRTSQEIKLSFLYVVDLVNFEVGGSSSSSFFTLLKVYGHGGRRGRKENPSYPKVSSFPPRPWNSVALGWVGLARVGPTF